MIKRAVLIVALLMVHGSFTACAPAPTDAEGNMSSAASASEAFAQENPYQHENQKAEDTVAQFYGLLRDNKIEEAYEIAYYKPEYQDLKEYGISQLKQFDNQLMTFEILGSEQLNDHIALVHLSLYNTPDEPEYPDIYTDIGVYVLEENGIYLVIQQDYNIPEEYLENITLDETRLLPDE